MTMCHWYGSDFVRQGVYTSSQMNEGGNAIITQSSVDLLYLYSAERHSSIQTSKKNEEAAARGEEERERGGGGGRRRENVGYL